MSLIPGLIDDVQDATTIGGAAEHGIPVMPSEMAPVDLIVVGSVAVDAAGNRVGKGEGYSDLEYAILRESDRVTETTSVATTIHELQMVAAIAPDSHDIPLDLICTPERVIRPADQPAPTGIDWSLLETADREAIPILHQFAPD